MEVVQGGWGGGDRGGQIGQSQGVATTSTLPPRLEGCNACDRSIGALAEIHKSNELSEVQVLESKKKRK